MRHSTTPISQLPFGVPVKDGDFDAHIVKKAISEVSGDLVEFVHGLGREPTDITIRYSDRAINYPEIVMTNKDRATLRFFPEWVSTYTSRKFIVIVRFG